MAESDGDRCFHDLQKMIANGKASQCSSIASEPYYPVRPALLQLQSYVHAARRLLLLLAAGFSGQSTLMETGIEGELERAGGHVRACVFASSICYMEVQTWRVRINGENCDLLDLPSMV